MTSCFTMFTLSFLVQVTRGLGVPLKVHVSNWLFELVGQVISSSLLDPLRIGAVGSNLMFQRICIKILYQCMHIF